MTATPDVPRRDVPWPCVHEWVEVSAFAGRFCKWCDRDEDDDE